jgi:hypothetical protein
MSILEQILDQTGPCLSSTLVKELVASEGITDTAARQRVSRGSDKIGKLYNLFPRNASFVYLKVQFGSEEYWTALIDALMLTEAAYGQALACLFQRGGVVPARHFEIACGAPGRLKKHLSHRKILDTLISAKLVQKIDIQGVGECVAFIQQEGRYDNAASTIRARLLAERLFLDGFTDWIKKLGLVSYHKVQVRDTFEDQPNFAGYSWDLTAPCYLGAVISLSETGVKPGFVVSDILLGSEITEAGLKPFLTKCDTTRSLKGVGRCLQFFIAEGFTQGAFDLAKRKGVIPVTPQNLYGKEVAAGFRSLITALTYMGDMPIDPAMIDEIFNRLKKFEGSVNNLRGTLFEYVVASIVEKNNRPHELSMNKTLNNKGKKSEVDVLAIYQTNARFIECKGYPPYSTVPDEEFKKWLTESVPNVFGYCKNVHPDWKEKELEFEFWTTGKLSDAALASFNDLSKKIKKSRYSIAYKDASQVKEAAALTKDKKLIATLNQHFLTHPVVIPSYELSVPAARSLATSKEDMEVEGDEGACGAE